MKLLYFGTVCDIDGYEKILEKCKTKESVSAIVFETALLSGLKKNGVDIEIHSFPMIPSFPSCKKIYWGNKKETLCMGYECTWLKTINVPILKQLSRKRDGKRAIKKFLKANEGEECAILSYSMPPFLTKSIIEYGKKYNVKCFSVVTDLLSNMYINARDNGFVSRVKNKYLSGAIAYQGEFSGYIYLTEAMSEVINPAKPYIVMEGIASLNNVESKEKCKKATPAAIMYAGMIEEEYGIINLLDAFEKANLADTELWIFGYGNAIDSVKERSEKNRKIKYLGRKNRNEIMDYEKKATLLVNPRNPEDEFTKYSFPSKTIEYMLSATPVLTTRLKGIPREYYEYVFSCNSNSVADLASTLEKAMSFSEDEMRSVGEKAKNFIVKEKNETNQGKRVADFILEEIKR